MKNGQLIAYFDESRQRYEATVMDITGAGPSTCKTLDVDVGGTTIKNVAHVKDAKPGERAWCLENEVAAVEAADAEQE